MMPFIDSVVVPDTIDIASGTAITFSSQPTGDSVMIELSGVPTGSKVRRTTSSAVLNHTIQASELAGFSSGYGNIFITASFFHTVVNTSHCIVYCSSTHTLSYSVFFK